jgi:hypothetical protein
MKVKWVYILIGNNNSGKTTFQKEVVKNLTGEAYDRLTCNISPAINTAIAKSMYKDIFVMNRSFQEKLDEYKNVRTYFKKYFEEKDICILSSHLATGGHSGNDLGVKKQVLQCLCGSLRARSRRNP